MKVTVIATVFGALGAVPKCLEKRLEESEIRGRIETIQTTEIGQNTEESPRDLRRFAVTQNPGKDYKLTPVWKATRSEIMIKY